MELTILIPYYNEEKRLESLVAQICKADAENRFYYIFIDDGSTDNSRELLGLLLKGSKLNFGLVNLDTNVGKSMAIQSSMDLVRTSHFAILDADLELDPKDIHRMWNIIESGAASAVFGFRKFLSHSSFTYRYTIGNKFISHWFGIFYNIVCTDIMCGLKLVPTNLIRDEKLKLKRFAIEIEIPMILWRHNIRAYEIEVDYFPRGWQEGKVIGLRDAIYIMYSISLRRMLFDRKKVEDSNFAGDMK